MELSSLWFILVTILFAGFFCLEGFDYGVGILSPFVGRDEAERRKILNSIGPFWHGNQVWMITAGGAMFAAFPQVYATLFSGFYLALFLMLAALIARGCALEFRNLRTGDSWRSVWDGMIFFGSAVPALLWGVAVSNLLKGVPIDAHMQFAGRFLDLLNGYAITGGLAFVLLFAYHGGIYAMLRVETGIAERIRLLLRKMGGLIALVSLVYVIFTHNQTDLFAKWGAGALLTGALLMFIISYLLLERRRQGWAFIFSSLTIVCVTAALFWGLYPRLIVSSLNPSWSLTVMNAASSELTLKLMTIAALLLVPVILAYQAWAYWLIHTKAADQDLDY